MEIADQIIANSGTDRGHLDEFGFPLKYRDTLNYTVARIIKRNQFLCVNPHDNQIYDLSASNSEPIKECNKSVIVLSGFDSPFARSFKYALVFEKLRELLPAADMDSYEVCDGLVFDGVTKRLENRKKQKAITESFENITKILNMKERNK